jgi:hypothetical protein
MNRLLICFFVCLLAVACTENVSFSDSAPPDAASDAAPDAVSDGGLTWRDAIVEDTAARDVSRDTERVDAEAGKDGPPKRDGSAPADAARDVASPDVVAPIDLLVADSTPPPPALPVALPWQGARLSVAYVVPHHLGDWIINYTVPAIRDAFQRDVVRMAALGVRVVKLPLSPSLEGMVFAKDAGSTLSPTIYPKLKSNLLAIIRLLEKHGIKVIVSFMLNDLYLRGPNGWIPKNIPSYYEWAYGSRGQAGLDAALAEVAAWQNGIVKAIANAGLDQRVVYYNLGSEMLYDFSGYAGVGPSWADITRQFVREIPKRVWVPHAKRAMDVLRSNEAARLAGDIPGDRPLAYTEFHAYPESHAVDLTASIAAVRAAFPKAHVVLGEFGSNLCEAAKSGGDAEDNQRDRLRDYWQQTESLRLPLMTNWHLWDGVSNTTCPSSRFGFGYSAERPRDALGYLVETFSALSGGDFEADNAGWYAGGTTSTATTPRFGANEADAATNQHYLRLTVPSAGLHWLCSQPFSLAGQRRVALEGYLRSNAPQVDINLHYRDGKGWTDGTGRQPLAKSVPLSGWSFHSIQKQLGGVLLSLPVAASEARICLVVNANATSLPTHVDLDALSVNSF